MVSEIRYENGLLRVKAAVSEPQYFNVRLVFAHVYAALLKHVQNHPTAQPVRLREHYLLEEIIYLQKVVLVGH